jgi:hypothetical protein
VWIGLIVIAALIYYFASRNFDYPVNWIREIIKCYKGDESKLVPNKMFSNIAFIDTGGASAIFGAYFGIMIDTMYLKGTLSEVNHTRFGKSLGRAFMSLLCISPLYLPMSLISDSSPMMIVYVFKRTIPFFLAMLILFSWVKLVHRRFGLINVCAKC